MNNKIKIVIIGMVMTVWGFSAQAEESSREMLKGLDEQVQEIKTDVLDIAAQLNQLEEKLLFPSNTQVSIFISLADGEDFRLDAVEIRMGDEPVAHHIYTFKELEALRKGGVQRIFTGNLRVGEHELEIIVSGKSPAGGDFQNTERFRIVKDVGPEIVEMALTAQQITLRDNR